MTVYSQELLLAPVPAIGGIYDKCGNVKSIIEGRAKKGKNSFLGLPSRRAHTAKFPLIQAFVIPEYQAKTAANKMMQRELPAPGEQLEWLTSFLPRRGLLNGHLQTIVGNYQIGRATWRARS